MAPSGDRATVTVLVGVTPEAAFDIFTREIDLWWKQGPAYRIAGRQVGLLNFEPGVGGRLLESFETKAGPRTFELGRITAWEPPARLEFEWRGVNFKPGEKTVVEVHFATSGRGTLVTVQHRGWSSLPADHAARHGLVGSAFSRMIGMWWGELMTSLRQHAGRSA